MKKSVELVRFTSATPDSGTGDQACRVSADSAHRQGGRSKPQVTQAEYDAVLPLEARLGLPPLLRRAELIGQTAVAADLQRRT